MRQQLLELIPFLLHLVNLTAELPEARLSQAGALVAQKIQRRRQTGSSRARFLFAICCQQHDRIAGQNKSRSKVVTSIIFLLKNIALQFHCCQLSGAQIHHHYVLYLIHQEVAGHRQCLQIKMLSTFIVVNSAGPKLRFGGLT